MTVDYGTELSFAGLDMALDGSMVSGLELLSQVAVIRLSTPRGSCLEAPDDGINLVDYLSRAMTPSEAAGLSGVIEGELLKDERFKSARADVDISRLITDGEMEVALELDAGDGPFRLVLGVSDAGVAILGGA